MKVLSILGAKVERLRKAERRTGDRYRNTGQWGLASVHYRRYLHKFPGDAAIWVQLGHAEKELQNYVEAEEAYRNAIALMPEDGDALLHLAHMLKRHSTADAAYKAFFELHCVAPDSDSLREVEHYRARRRTHATVPPPGTLLFDVQDLFSALETHGTITGIQRVQVGVAMELLADPTLDPWFVVIEVGGDGRDGVAAFLRVDASAVREIILAATESHIDRRALRGMLTRARVASAPVAVASGATLVLLGAFWGIPGGIGPYLEAVRVGAKLVIFVHDVIPITHPELFDADLANAFWRGMAELLFVADMILTNSQYTSAEIRRVFAGTDVEKTPMRKIALAHCPEIQSHDSDVWPRPLASIKSRPYALYVSTIEGRKNHLYVVRVWQKMIDEGVEVPHLVFAGRVGWHVEELIGLLEYTNNLDGRVHILHDLTDAELATLYRHALFSVFTSLAEGWGLPVGESLTHAVPVVASRTSAIPEVGGDFADYINPFNIDDGLPVFRRLIVDKAYNSARRQKIREEFVPRRWSDVGREVIDALTNNSSLSRTTHPRTIMLEPGVVARLGRLSGRCTPVEGYFGQPFAIPLARSFYEAEATGAWLRGQSGTFSFRTGRPRERIIVFLSLCVAPWAIGRRGSASLADYPRRRWLSLAEGMTLVRLEGLTDPEGEVTVRLEYEAMPDPVLNDGRCFAIGLRSFGWVPVEGFSRTAMREEMLFA